MATELSIKIKIGDNSALMGLPLYEGQYIDREGDEELVDSQHTFVIVCLGTRTDTTAAQEQYLNTNPAVAEWEII